MIIETTIYIKNYYLCLLAKASKVSGRSKRSIISSLMFRLSRDHDVLAKTWEQIKYQKRGEIGGYHRLHISLKPGEYEMFLDLRKFFKQSVSLLVAHAIDEYLDDFINKIKSIPDNYPVINYALNKLVIDNVVSWVLSWGVTTKLLLHPIHRIT
jgi:hypothetical protein